MDASRRENLHLELTETERLQSLAAWRRRFDTRWKWQCQRSTLFLVTALVAATTIVGTIVISYSEETLVRWYGGKPSGHTWYECFPTLQPVTSADFSGASFSDEHLLRLARLQNLETLDLSGTRITDDGLQHLRNFPKLTAINLNNTRITDRGIAHLAKCTRLTEIDLAQTRVTDNAVDQLRKFKQLKRVDLTETQATPEATAAFVAQWPEIEIGPRRSFILFW